MKPERDENRIDRLTDALVDDVVNRSDDKLLDEVSEAYGHRQALATQFDDIVNPILKQGTVKRSDEWRSFDVPSRPLAPVLAAEADLLDEGPPLGARAINTRWIILAAFLIIIVGLPSGYYILKRQVQEEANIETAQKIREIETGTARKIRETEIDTAQKMQEVEQQKKELQQQRFALLNSIAESRQRAEEAESRQSAEQGGSRQLSTRALPFASPSLTIRAPVQPRTGGNFVQLFFLAQHANDVQQALRRIQSRFPKQGKNPTLLLQADVGGKDQFYGIQIGTFETLELAERACATLSGPRVQCVVQPSGRIAPPIALDALGEGGPK
jgi:hypothetical protein